MDAAKFKATHDFVARGTNAIGGYVWYKDRGKGNPKYADMGRTGASAVAHYLSPLGGKTYSDFGAAPRLSATATNALIFECQIQTPPDDRGKVDPAIGSADALGRNFLGLPVDPAFA